METAPDQAGPAADQPETTAAPDTQAVCAAFALGWQMARLYEAQVDPPGQTPGTRMDPPEYLPGLSALSADRQTELGLEQADTGITRLAAYLTGDAPPPDSGD